MGPVGKLQRKWAVVNTLPNALASSQAYLALLVWQLEPSYFTGYLDGLPEFLSNGKVAAFWVKHQLDCIACMEGVKVYYQQSVGVLCIWLH
jgi:hypothetical protein